MSQRNPSTDPGAEAAVVVESPGAGGRRDIAGWLAAACAAAAWLFLKPRYLSHEHMETFGLLGTEIGPTVFGWAFFALAAFLGSYSGALRRRPLLGVFLGLAFIGCSFVFEELTARFEATLQPVVMPFSWMGWLVAQAGGEESVVSNGNLLFFEPQGAFTIKPSWGFTAFRTLLLFWLAGGLLIGLRGSKEALSAFPRLILLPILFFGLRYGLAIIDLAGTENALQSQAPAPIMTFWQPWSIVLTLLASAVVLAAMDAPFRWAPPLPRPAFTKTVTLALLAGLSLGAAYGWEDPGTPKQGRVLVDDRLTGFWEPAGRLLTVDRYGDFSTYSLAAMVEHLSRRFSVSVNGQDEYTPELLDNYDVLILKTPDKEIDLSPEEVAAIRDWVLAGGGLFAISDHTDLNGMSSVLNPLTSQFGIQFRFDATANMAHGGFDYWYPRVVHEHPVSAGLGRFELMTPCSIHLSKGAKPVLTVDQSVSTRGDYAGSSHFSGMAPDPSSDHGMLVLAAAAEWDKGRVLAFSDSTVLSSFAYYMHSHSDFILRGVSWLNRENSAWYWLQWGFLAIGVAAGAALLFSLQAGGLVAAALALSAGLYGGAWASASLAAHGLVVPDPVDDALEVGFVREGGFARLPAVLGTPPADLMPDENLMTFIQTPQRLGYETRIVSRDPGELESLDVLVLLNPDVERFEMAARQAGEVWDVSEHAVPEDWVEAVDEWVRAGGRLVILTRAAHWNEQCRQVHVQVDPYLDPALEWTELESPLPHHMALQWAPHGEGRILLVIGSEEFDTRSMGHCMQYPGREERTRYDVAYWIFGELVGVPLPERRSYSPF